MLIKQLVLSTVLAGLLNTAIAQTNGGLTAYIGKEVLDTGKAVRDTMTRQQFLEYGRVKLSDSRFTVSSFSIVFSKCDRSPSEYDGFKFFDITGNSFKTKEITEMLNIWKECIRADISQVKFLNFNKQVIDTKKGAVIVLVN